MEEQTSAEKRARRRPGVRRAFVVVLLLAAVAAPLATAAFGPEHSASPVLRGESRDRATKGGDKSAITTPQAGVARPGQLPKSNRLTKPTVLHLEKAHSAVFDVRSLKSVVVKRERPEDGGPDEAAGSGAEVDGGSSTPGAPETSIPSAAGAPAPGPDTSFNGLDFATWGAGHPPDENGDVGPTYYIQTVNSSIGIYDKATGSRVAAFTFNAFMSQGQFGNLCDTDNFGDPVVLYDSFENRWFITDFAFKLDAFGNVNPQTVYQCFAVSKTGDPVTGGWNYYSILDPGGLGDYPKFGVWPDGIYMSANMFGYAAGSSYIAPHMWALNKAQMYAGAPSPQVVDFTGPSSDFTLLPANSRLQTGIPPAGSAEYFVSSEVFLNALTVYKLHVDWDKVSTSTFTGPDTQLEPNCWPNASVANAATPANSLDTLQIRAMAQAQYTNLAGAESIWVDHTVQRGVSATNTTCNAPTGGNATVRWYQANVTGGTVAANVVQGATFDPEGANTFFRFVPSLAVDRTGDMAMDYTKSNATTNPQIKYAGRLAGDPANTLGQSEQTLIDGTGSQSGNCGASACSRWGDYSGMALDPNGCEFWMTGEYYATTGLNDLTRVGSFHYPGCTTVGNGTLSGNVSDGTKPIAGATVALGSRTTTTDSSGNYSFSVPAGTYATETADDPGFNTGTASTLVVPDGGTSTQNFTLSAASQSGCFVDNTQTAFQRGVPTNCDLTSSPGTVVLAAPDNTAAKNTTVTPNGFGFTNTSWAGQTFTPTVSGQLKRIDVELFCSGCSGTNPNITVSIRNTTGNPAVPTGADLGSATLPGFNDGGAGGLKTVSFATPVSVTAGTRYAFIFRATATRTGTYAYTCSCGGNGFSDSNPYTSGQRVTSANSGTTWAADTTAGGRDLNFITYINPGFAPSGTFVSSLKDANPTAGSTPTWTTLSFTASTPSGTGVKFQLAGSNSQYGPFNYVGPDGTSGTYFTTSGANLSQFNGFRYLRYEAFLSTSNASVTPSLSSVSVCFTDVQTGIATGTAPLAATGTFGGTTTLSATLTSGGSPLSGKSIAFTLNGSPVGSATTDGTGTATLNGASLAGIGAGSYPAGVGASFAGDATYNPSSGTAALTVNKADQTITVGKHAPASAAYNTSFDVSASAPGGAVDYSSAGPCTNSGAMFTITSGTGTCTVSYDQSGNANYNAAPEVTESVTAEKADQTITITTHAPSTAVYATSFTVAANAPGGLVTYSSGGVCLNFDDSFTMMSGTGTCTVKYDQSGDANYNPASEVTETVTAQKADQAITVTTHAPAAAVYGTGFGVAATGGGSGNAVTFSSGGSCSNSGSTFTMTSGTGACSVEYDEAGDDNYDAAPQVVESTNASPASLTITANDRTKVQGTTLDLGTTAFSTSGLVDGDGIASVTLTSAGADASAPAGTYPIVPSAAVAAAGTDLGNYSVTYANGTLTVTPATNNGPNVRIITPPEGATYKQDKVVNASYRCSPKNRVAVASCVGTVPSGSPIDTSTIGQHSFTVTATDVNGGTTVLTTHYTVIYTWSGFFSVANESTAKLNVVPAGSLVALIFGLNGDRSLDVLAAGSPDSVAVSCPAWQLKTIRPATGTPTGLTYSTATSRYTYGWQTDASWVGTCRQFRLATNDGTAAHTAVFKFTG
ncbi:MAG: PxKF domain-containing protein [Gaiellaceae bacterium]